jgi:hypothetical protein
MAHPTFGFRTFKGFGSRLLRDEDNDWVNVQVREGTTGWKKGLLLCGSMPTRKRHLQMVRNIFALVGLARRVGDLRDRLADQRRRPETGPGAAHCASAFVFGALSSGGMPPRRILHVETNLGLRPGGVERLGAVLLELGLAERIGARVADGLRAPAFVERRDPLLGARNVPALAALAIEQADRVGEILDEGAFPVVLGGDDSVLLGCLLALRRRGSAGLMMLDAHTDFWDLPDGTGELSDSDLWIGEWTSRSTTRPSTQRSSPPVGCCSTSSHRSSRDHPSARPTAHAGFSDPQH